MIVDDVKNAIDAQDVNLYGGTSLDDVKQVFSDQSVDVVIMGAGIDLDARLEIIKFIFEKSKSTTVHMKDWESGPAGMLPFVNGILNGAS